MTDLSPAARAVIAAQVRHRCFSEWSTVNDPPCHLQYINRSETAAILRALADHRPQRLTLDGPLDHWDPDQRTRRELRNIAAELEVVA